MLHVRIGLSAFAFSLMATTALAQTALPSFIVPGTVTVQTYDGVTDDLLTGGLGATGIGTATPPAVADPANPTPAELRRRAIHNAYRGLVDTATGGGWRVLYGPNLDAAYNDTGREGLVAGREYIALSDDGTGSSFQTVMVQIPANFDTARPCMVTGPSSGSRNAYGAVGTTAEWAFRNGCAIAYTDKGTGNAYHDLTRDTVYNRFGQLVSRTAAGADTNFAAQGTHNLNGYSHANPNRLAYKQAHAGRNVQANWGLYTLQAIQFGFYALNDMLGNGAARFTPANTTVISAGVSNGGGGAFAAAEQDTAGLIDGVVGGEPNVIPAPSPMTVSYGGQAQVSGKHFLDYYTLAAIYAPCAALSSSLAGTPVQTLEPTGVPAGVTARANRCTSLKDTGLLTSATLAEQANESLQKLRAYGFLAEGDYLIPFMEWANAYRQIIDTYPAGMARARVDDNLCGVSFAATDTAGRPTQLPAATASLLFAAGNIIPPAGGISVIADNAANGPIIEQAAVSRLTGRQDLNIDSAYCHRMLVTDQAVDGYRRTFPDAIWARRVAQGMGETTFTGNLRGKPALIVHGRSDSVLPPNHHGRAYLGLNKTIEGAASKLSYIEVTNGQHFDALIPTLANANREVVFIPLHYYFERALDAMLAHLRSGTALPPSQVVRATPRGTAAITAANRATLMPEFATTPAAADAITVANNTVSIPR